MFEHARKRDVHRIRGRAVDEIETIRRLMNAQRTRQRERVGRAAAVLLGRHHRDVAERLQRVMQHIDAARQIAVVIAE